MTDTQGEAGITRRDLLRRGVAVGGFMWAMPTVSRVPLQVGDAEAASGPTGNPPGGPESQPETEVLGNTLAAPAGGAPRQGAETLPFTGTDAAVLAALGGGLVAAGKAILSGTDDPDADPDAADGSA